jgi:ABC-type multidrug transport system ATPase subunit
MAATDSTVITVKQLEHALDVGVLQQSLGVLPEDQRLSLAWENLTYSIAMPPPVQNPETTVSAAPPAEMRDILHGISGSAPSGKLTAIMGPSGSGKTSLLNALAARVPLSTGATMAGTVLLNGLPAGGGAGGADGSSSTGSGGGVDLAAVSAYVEQDDVLFALSTVYETLLFAAQLRLPSATPMAEKRARVEAVIAELGLTTARDTLIGNERTRGISGGERKRVNVGSCMLHDPKLIFVDEPTSGLDSFQALNVMSTLKGLCNRGRTVLLSIHQPRSSIYAMLDGVLLLSQGRVVYGGAAGAPCSAHFAALGFPVPPDFNPADHFLDIASKDTRTPALAVESQARVDKLVGAFAKQEEDAAAAAPTCGGRGARGAAAGGAGRSIAEHTPASGWVAFRLLLHRNWKEQTRDKTALALKYVMAIFFSVIFGLVYFRMDHDQISIQNRSGILFFVAMNQAFGSVIGCSQVIPVQLKVVSRERAARLYEIFPFYAAAFMVNLPLEILPQFLNGSIIYFMSNLRGGAEHFVVFIAILALENFVGIALGMVISAWLKSVEMAPQVAPAFVVLFLMFSGFLINDSSVPVWLIWLKHISFIRYAFTALAINEFKGATFACDAAVAGQPKKACLDGDEMLERLAFDTTTIGDQCIYLFALLVAFNLIAYAVLVRRKPRYLKLKQL